MSKVSDHSERKEGSPSAMLETSGGSKEKEGSTERKRKEPPTKDSQLGYSSPHSGRSDSTHDGSEEESRRSPFTKRIDDYTVPETFWKLSELRRYDGTEDPVLHLAWYSVTMYGKHAEEPIMCKVFPFTLANWALSWFEDLEPGTIHSWEQLQRLFLARFSPPPPPRRDPVEILRKVKQHPSETLRQYLERFDEEARLVRDMDWREKLFWIKQGITKGTLFWEVLMLSTLWTYEEFIHKAKVFMCYEEMNLGIRRASPERNALEQGEAGRTGKKRFGKYTPLTKSRVQVMKECDGKYFKYKEKPNSMQRGEAGRPAVPLPPP